MLQFLENVIIIFVALVPAVAALGKWLDMRSAKRQEANHEFNVLILWGVESIGNLTAANTEAIKNKGEAGEENATKEMEVALKEYRMFHQEIDKFNRKQAAKTL